MSVSRKIFERADRAGWFCKVDDEFVNLGRDKTKALKKWHELCAEHEPGSTITTKALLTRTPR